MTAGRESATARPAAPRGRRRAWLRPLLGTGSVVGVLVAWLYLAPAQVGGSTAYAVIVGNSMEPSLHRGDLVLVRPQTRYGVGDVVLYDDPQLRSNVLHRIERVVGDRYVLKGDNNEFLDTTRPTSDRIVGSLWVRVPAAGRLATWLREPSHAALLVGLVTFVALCGGVAAGTAVAGRGRRRRHVRHEARTPSTELQHLPVVLSSVCVVLGVLTVVAFTRPASRLAQAALPYTHEAQLDYSAAVPRSPVYPDGRVSTGEPVFLRLVPRLRVEVGYRLASQGSASLRGTIGLTARLSDGRGWSRALQVAPEREFAGATARAGGTIDLSRVQRLTEQVQQLTGSSQAAYSLTLQPRVTTAGAVDGRSVAEIFAPEVELELADLRLQPELDGADAGSFLRRRAGSGMVSEAAAIRVGRLQLPVSTARLLGPLGLLASLLVSGVALAAARRRGSSRRPAELQTRHGRLVVDVASHPVDPARVVDLADVDDLVRIAVHHGRLILHTVDRGSHLYLVEDGDSVFRYRATAQSSPEADTVELRPPPRLVDVEA